LSGPTIEIDAKCARRGRRFEHATADHGGGRINGAAAAPDSGDRRFHDDAATADDSGDRRFHDDAAATDDGNRRFHDDAATADDGNRGFDDDAAAPDDRNRRLDVIDSTGADSPHRRDR